MEVGAVIKHDIKKAPKTGEWRYMKPKVLEEKCTACKVCIPFCPEAAISLERRTHSVDRVAQGAESAGPRSTIHDPRYASIDYDFCKGCGVCADVCPERAIIMQKNDAKK